MWNLTHFDMCIEELGLRRLFINKCHFVNVDYVDFKTPYLMFFKFSRIIKDFLSKCTPICRARTKS